MKVLAFNYTYRTVLPWKHRPTCGDAVMFSVGLGGRDRRNYEFLLPPPPSLSSSSRRIDVLSTPCRAQTKVEGVGGSFESFRCGCAAAWSARCY